MKQLKYRVKRACLSAWPSLWWWVRRSVKGDLEPEVELILSLCEANGTFVDVGANWGAYSFRALKLGRRVHACEPQPLLAQVLRQGLGPLGITVHEVALSDSSSTRILRIPKNDYGYSTIEERNLLQGSADLTLGVRAQEVSTCRLDDLEIPRVSLIKIDVEGHEMAVLTGAAKLLERDAPSVIVEAEDRHNPGTRGRVWQFFAQRRYLAFWYRGGLLVELASESEVNARNLIFVHPDRVASLGSCVGVTRLSDSISP